MTASLVDDLLSQLQGAPVNQMAQQLGTDPTTTSDAIAAALPMIVGALGRNAQQPGGADALLGALQRDHAGQGAVDLGGLLGAVLGGGGGGAPAGMGAGAGGLGDLLGSVLGGALGGASGGMPANRQLDAGGILGHIFGGAQGRAEAGLEQGTNLNGGQAAALLKMLAPIVMSYLAQHVNARGMDAGGLGSALGQERARVQQQGGLGGGLLNAVLDQDGDGQVGLNDLLRMGGSLLGGRR
jgi:hypothetical protein